MYRTFILSDVMNIISPRPQCPSPLHALMLHICVGEDWHVQRLHRFLDAMPRGQVCGYLLAFENVVCVPCSTYVERVSLPCLEIMF